MGRICREDAGKWAMEYIRNDEDVYLYNECDIINFIGEFTD